VTDDSESLEPDLSGEVLDRYRLIRRLGIGGMGVVYEAEHTTLEKQVAVKLLLSQFAKHDVARKRFLREAKAATKVKHPNVVDISDFGETADGRVYFVMELLSGRDLGELLTAESRLPWPRAQKIILQIVSALEAAHGLGIIHRDMKPSNCFLIDVAGVEGQDFIKVLDFGIAKYTGKLGEETQELTSTRELLGTANYMAPEMALGVSDEPRSDIYAVGVMLYRMLVGELPFKDGTAFLILAKHVNEAPPRPRDLVSSIPPGVEAIILKALAKDPDDRFESMKALREAIAADGLGEAEAGEETMVLGEAPMRDAVAVEKTEQLSPLHQAEDTGGTKVDEPTEELASAAVERAPPREDVEAPPSRSVGKLVALSLLGIGIVVGAMWLGSSMGTPERDAVQLSVKPNASVSVEPGAEGPAPLPQPQVPQPDDLPPTIEDIGHEEALGSSDGASTVEGTTTGEVEPVAAPPVRRSKPKPKPRSDTSVAKALRRKVEAKCQDGGTTSVRVEGIIEGGRVSRVMVSPSTVGRDCVTKIVKAAKFGTADGTRPMPIVTVQL
jgi:tRNA A-37 threonylcarbamoyl transferase component Bud32